MQSSLLFAGIVVSAVLAIIVFVKFEAKQTSFIPVKIGNKIVHAEIADTFAKQIFGLMGRKSMPEDQGMLFVFNDDLIEKFWMFNTSIPLDMIWIDSGKSIIYIQQNAQPCPVYNCPTYGPDLPARYVLEVNANYTVENNVSVGDKVYFNLTR